MLYTAFEHAKQIVRGHESSFPEETEDQDSFRFPAEAIGFLSSFDLSKIAFGPPSLLISSHTQWDLFLLTRLLGLENDDKLISVSEYTTIGFV
jgi:hypothetical protein